MASHDAKPNNDRLILHAISGSQYRGPACVSGPNSDGTDGFEIIKQAEAMGSRSIRSDVVRAKGGLGGEAAVVSQPSDETARPMPAPVKKASAQRKQASPRGRVCFNRGFWPVCHSESEPRETTDRARLSTAQLLWIFVMLVEARTARHPRKVLESVILHLVGG